MSLQLHIPRTKPSVTLNQTNHSENLVTDCCHVSIMSISNVHVCVKAQARKYANNLPFNWFRMHCSICLNFCVVTSRYQAHEAFADADVTCSRMSIWVYEQKKWLTEKKTTNNNNWEKKNGHSNLATANRSALLCLRHTIFTRKTRTWPESTACFFAFLIDLNDHKWEGKNYNKIKCQHSASITNWATQKKKTEAKNWNCENREIERERVELTTESKTSTDWLEC